jgi:hypothetical protein
LSSPDPPMQAPSNTTAQLAAAAVCIDLRIVVLIALPRHLVECRVVRLRRP